MKDLILVVDGGRSSLRALAMDPEGSVLAWERSSGLPPVLSDWRPTADRVIEICRDLFKKSGCKPQDFSVAAMGLAGLDRESDQQAFLACFSEGGFPFRVFVESDARQTLRAADPEAPVAIGLFGTGSAFFARSPDRSIHRTGGWGGLLGDVGSGYELAKEGFAAVFRAYDGVGPDTSLTEKLCAMGGVESPPDLLKSLYALTFEPSVWARYAPTVLREASKGDPVASEIVENQVVLVARNLFGLMAKAGMPTATGIHLTGGLIEEGNHYFKSLKDRIEADLPDHPVQVLAREAYWGGWELGRRYLEGRGE